MSQFAKKLGRDCITDAVFDDLLKVHESSIRELFLNKTDKDVLSPVIVAYTLSKNGLGQMEQIVLDIPVLCLQDIEAISYSFGVELYKKGESVIAAFFSCAYGDSENHQYQVISGLTLDARKNTCLIKLVFEDDKWSLDRSTFVFCESMSDAPRDHMLRVFFEGYLSESSNHLEKSDFSCN